MAAANTAGDVAADARGAGRWPSLAITGCDRRYDSSASCADRRAEAHFVGGRCARLQTTPTSLARHFQPHPLRADGFSG